MSYSVVLYCTVIYTTFYFSKSASAIGTGFSSTAFLEGLPQGRGFADWTGAHFQGSFEDSMI